MEPEWFVAGLLAVVFLSLSLLNWITFFREFARSSAPYWVPLLPGLAGVGAFSVAPNPTLEALWWLPLLLDAGCVPGFLYSAIWHLRRRLRER